MMQILSHSTCGCYSTGAVIWRGLHARCGVIYGLGPTRKPLNTGRADYFGAIPNLAARVCATAQYGQTLIEPTMKLKGATWDKQEVHGTLAEAGGRLFTPPRLKPP